MLNLVVVYGSSHVGVSIIQYLARLKSLVIAGQSREAEDAVQMIKAKRPQVVIIDALLKGGSGLNLLRRTKQLEWPPVVFMTAASPDSQYRRECMRQGADYYFQLPDEIDGMVNTLSQPAALFSTVGEETTSATEPQQKNSRGSK
jgi:DNA-binding NarL/FixJ family response regulator